jgi:hypothetical protein
MAESPMLAPDVQPVDTVIWVGAAERPAFLDQARWLAEAWPQARLRISPDRHHLDITEGFEAPDSPLMASLLDGLYYLAPRPQHLWHSAKIRRVAHPRAAVDRGGPLQRSCSALSGDTPSNGVLADQR